MITPFLIDRRRILFASAALLLAGPAIAARHVIDVYKTLVAAAAASGSSIFAPTGLT